MRLNRWAVAAAATAAVLATASMAAFAYTGEQYAKDAKVSMQQARAKALAQVSGTIKDAELEKEGGGSGLRYSFDIKSGHGLREVGIDAVTGKVLENSAESGQAEAQEARAEHEHADRAEQGERENDGGAHHEGED